MPAVPRHDRLCFCFHLRRWRAAVPRRDQLCYDFIYDFFYRFLKILKRWDSGCTICTPKRRRCLKNTTKLAFSLTTCFLLPQQVQPLVQLHQSDNLAPFIMTPSSLYCYTCSSGYPHHWCISAVDNSYGEHWTKILTCHLLYALL